MMRPNWIRQCVINLNLEKKKVLKNNSIFGIVNENGHERNVKIWKVHIQNYWKLNEANGKLTVRKGKQKNEEKQKNKLKLVCKYSVKIWRSRLWFFLSIYGNQ